MNSNASGRTVLAIAFALGLMTVVWVGMGFVGTSSIALVMTVAIGGVYVLGALEVRRFRTATSSLAAALADVPQVAVVFEPAKGEKCERCWKILPDVGTHKHPGTCQRCNDALG